MQPTPSRRISDGLVLRPAGPTHLTSLASAFAESRPEVHRALPWLDPDMPVHPQLRSYLEDVSRLGSRGLSHHWAIIEKGRHSAEAHVDGSGERFAGLVALDHTPHLTVGHWNLGYWIRTSSQRRGLATVAIDAALDWIGTAGGGPTAVEIRVDPENLAGHATAERAVDRWGGRRHPEGDGEVEFEGRAVHHLCYVIPRLPLSPEDAP